MSLQHSPGSEKMDISETSNSSQDNEHTNSSHVLRLVHPGNMNCDKLDNEKSFEETQGYANRSLSLTQNATNSHPLMYSPTSPISPDFPDLIPEKHKNKNTYVSADSHTFMPNAHSSTIEMEKVGKIHDDSLEKLLTLPVLDEYIEKLPDFPESPTVMRSLKFDLPVEISQTESSDNENDKSVYEAHLSSNLQNVSLIMNEKEGNLNFLAHGQKSNKLRRVKFLPTEASPDSDVSSLDSVSESLKSEDVFAWAQHYTNDEEQQSVENEAPIEPIEPLSAAEERKHARHWQRMLLPGGEQRTIDMRVIEPYKRVLSHGGYVRAGGNTAIVVFSACFLPDRSRVDYDYVMDNLFLYVLWTLERLVTEDYVLVYLHGAATRLPTFGWFKRCYHMVGRRLRKNLTRLFIVHPTLWIKTMLFMSKPFISSKFYQKITYVTSLRELHSRVPLDTNAVPDKVKAYDNFHYGVQ